MKTTESASPSSEARNMVVGAILLVIAVRSLGLDHAQLAWYQILVSLALGVTAYLGLVAFVEAGFNKLATVRLRKVDTPVPIVVRSE